MDKNKGYNESKIILSFIIGMIIMVAILGSFYTIQPGQRGVLLTFGKPSEQVMQPGFHFKIPIAQTIKKMNTQTQKYKAEAEASSKDLQVVNTTVAVNYNLDPNKVIDIYSDLGTDYTNRIIMPAVQEAVKSATAEYTAEQLIIERAYVKNKIQLLITKRLKEKNLLVGNVSITNFDFSKVFNKAVESKVTALQNALKAKNDLQRIKIEKEQTITRAQAQAKSVEIDANAQAYKITVEAKSKAKAIQLIRDELMKDKIIIQYEYLQKWDGVLPKYNANGSPVPFIDINR